MQPLKTYAIEIDKANPHKISGSGEILVQCEARFEYSWDGNIWFRTVTAALSGGGTHTEKVFPSGTTVYIRSFFTSSLDFTIAIFRAN